MGQAIDLALAPQAETVLDLFRVMAVQIVIYGGPDQRGTGLAHPLGKGVQGFDLRIAHIHKDSHHVLDASPRGTLSIGTGA